MANIRKSFNFRSGLQVDNDNFVINSNGLVGIGTSSPSQYLCNIHGDLRVTGSIIGRDASFSSGLEVLGITTVGVLTASSIDAPEGRIGILTATQIQIGTGDTLTSLVGYAITDAWLVPDNIGIVTTRRVGIGTDLTPSEQLRVVGDTNVTGTFTAGSIESNTNVTNGISTFNDIRVGTAISISAGVITATTFDGNFTGTVTGTATTAQFLTDGANIIGGTISDDRLPDVITSNINILTGTSYFNQIGVGTNAPLSDIHVRKDVQTEIQVTSDSNAALIGLGRSNNITGYNGVFRYGNNDVSFPYSDVYSLDIMNYGPGNINFYLNPSSVAGATGGFFWHNEANRLMALTSAGNLGIGITNPTNKFEVVGTSYVSGNAEFGDSVTVTNNVILGLNGRIGINSTSPTEKLDVVGNIVASGSITGSNIEADNINVVGFVTASQFKGDGSQLTALTGAAGGTYGDATTVPQLVVNNEGRITGINQVTIQQSTGGQIGIFSGGVEVGTGITALNFIGTGNTFAVSGATVDISIQGGGGGSSDPVGTIVAWSGSVASIPSEYQLCDGSAASTSALQAITGANVPDLTNRFIVGAGNTTVAGTYPGVGVGSTGGSANAVLIGHSHGTYGDESGYRHPVRAGADASFDWDSHTASSNDGTYDTNSRTDATGQNAAGISSTSQTGTNANLPPYYALCYIIKHTATASSGGGISGITVEDEGSALSTTATTLNFVGAGVTASGTGATKTITINGGGSGGGGSSLWSSGIGSDIYYNSGDVGIGTTNPTAVLDVDGYTELDDVNISGVVTSTSFVKSGGTNLQYLMADGSVSTVSGISTSDGDGIIAYANFDGTLSSPITARAQRGFSSITKTSSTNGRYTLTFATAQPNADYIVQATGGTNSTAVVNVLSATTTEILLQTGTNSNGAVNLEYVYITVYDSLSGGTGIGTDGNVNTTGIITAHLGSFDNLYVSGISTFEGNINANSDLDVDGHTNLDNVSISGIVTVSPGILTATTLRGLNAKVYNVLEVDNISWLDGGAEFGPRYFNKGNASISTTGIATFAGVNVSGISTLGTVYGDGSNLTGLTGAGASTYGDANTTPIITVDSNGRITGISTVATAGSGGGGSSLWSSGDSQSIYYNSGDVGIGSTSPTAKLDIVGTLNVSGISTFNDTVHLPANVQLRFDSNNISDSLRIYDDGLNSRFISNHGIFFGTDSTWAVLNESQNTYKIRANSSNVLLYHSGSAKFETTGYGATITGGLQVSGIVTATTFSGSGANLTGLTGASASTYGDANTTPIITVDSNGRITGISTVATAGSGGGVGGGSQDPVGTIVAWSGSVASIPSDYQLCDGSSASTSALQAITGANVPDLRDRFIVGASDISGTGTYPGVGVGSTGGEASVTLTESQIPSHTHGYDRATQRNVADGGVNGAYVSSLTSATTDPTGSGQAHENLPPYYALCYIIKHTATTGGITLLPAQTIDPAAQATSIEFTGIPADALEITVMFEGASLSGTDDFEIQLGTASGYIVSNYDSMSSNEGGNDKINSTSSFILRSDNASHIRMGSMLIKKASDTSYVQTGQFAVSPSSTEGGNQTYGSLSSVSGTVNKLRIKSSGSNHFDAGSISVSYKTASGGSGSSSGFVLETAKSSATGNSDPIEFTGIPADAQEITLMFNGVSLSGDNEYLVQLGTAVGYATTGYASLSQDEGGTNPSDSTEGFIILGNAGHELRGKFDITKFSDTAYTFEGQARKNTTGGAQSYGSLNGVNGAITKLRIKPTGSNNFDAGSINISYKTASSGGGSGGGGITVQDEGSALSTTATTLNFVGAGVTASGTGATKTITINGGGSGGGGGTVSSGNFTASPGSPSTLESYAYDSAELVFEYTVFVKNGSDYQTQKLLVMRDGTTVDSTQYAIMHSNGLLVQLDATISGSNLLLRATPETGVTGNTTYRIKREVV